METAAPQPTSTGSVIGPDSIILVNFPVHRSKSRISMPFHGLALIYLSPFGEKTA